MKKIITILLLGVSLIVVGSTETNVLDLREINQNIERNKDNATIVSSSKKSTKSSATTKKSSNTKSSTKKTSSTSKSTKSSNSTAKKSNTTSTSSVSSSGTQTGIASFYGGKWHGRKTANGEIYNQNTLTAAHKTLPFNTKVKVTNVNNGKSVIVRINNRGPYAKGRIIDLSRAAFSSIASLNQGITRVKLEVLN